MGKYDDIINLPHHESKNHPRMSISNRAAQFAPFAALVGFSDAIKNSEERYTKPIELSEERKEEIEKALSHLALAKESKEIEVTYFILKSKDLGQYLTYKGIVKKIDIVEKKIIFTNRKSISFKNIYNIKDSNDE